jgi:class 3 adenylate cyclase
MKGWLERIGRIGTTEATSPVERRSIRITNISAVLVSFASVLYVVNGLAQGGLALAVTGFFQLVAFLGVLAFSRAGKHLAGRVFYSVSANLFMTINTLIQGRVTNTHFYEIPVVVGVWLIFPAAEWATALVLSLAGVVMFVLFDLGVLAAHPLMHLDHRQITMIARTNDLINLAIMFGFAFYSFVTVTGAEAQLEEEREKSERLLLNVLPRAIADRLKKKPGSIADRHEEATILFADIVGFTTLAERTPPGELIALLDRLFSRFDELAERFGLEKIKTIGDAYMVAGGLPDARPDHARAIARMALEMRRAITDSRSDVEIRIGIHTGPVVAGVIGQRKFAYDLWGDSVNTASRMESHGVPGKIHVTAAVYEKLRTEFEFAPRGTVSVKGKGELATYFLEAELTPRPIGQETPVPPRPQ